MADSSNEHESIVGWGCYPNNENHDNSRNSRHSERIAKESSLLQYKAAAKNENNSTETDHASMPLGIFASKSVPTSKNLAAWLLSRLAAKKVAFTLAEVLITLGIIGVVAALTLPSLIQHNIEKQRVTQLKKAYSELSQAYNFAVEEYGSPTEWGMTGMYDEQSHYIMASNMKKFLKLSEDCVDMSDSEAKKVCGQEGKVGKSYDQNAIRINTFKRNGRSLILSDGTTLAFRVYSGRCNFQYGAIKNVCGNITVDVNGSKYPNQVGEDQFGIYFTKEKLVPAGIKGAIYTFERACNRTIKSPYPSYDGGTNMYACTAWVLYNENQDYLHCDDLSWDGKHFCKDK